MAVNPWFPQALTSPTLGSFPGHPLAYPPANLTGMQGFAPGGYPLPWGPHLQRPPSVNLKGYRINRQGEIVRRIQGQPPRARSDASRQAHSSQAQSFHAGPTEQDLAMMQPSHQMPQMGPMEQYMPGAMEKDPGCMMKKGCVIS